MSWLKNLFGFGNGHDAEELARRLDVTVEELQKFQPVYREFSIPKKSGGKRRISAPIPELKDLQRRILKRLLSRLKTHPAATGFQKGESFVTNARRHQGKAVVVRMDIQDFFPSISAKRIEKYFRFIGWNREATGILMKLCTWEDSLPQGAPTSPRLSNLVNYRLDTRLEKVAARFAAVYTRYADDLTFSFDQDNRKIGGLIKSVRRITEDEGYKLHHRRKLHIRRRHQRQVVTGLVVNRRANLSRKTRRRLRAVEHRAGTDWRNRPTPEIGEPWRPSKKPTLTESQLEGWRGLVSLIARHQR